MCRAGVRVIPFKLAVLAALVGGCGGVPEDGPRFDHHRGAITGGQPYGGHPMVGQLRFSIGEGSELDAACTATRIGPVTLLTAAHCIGHRNTQFDFDDGQEVGIVSQLRHPDFDETKPYLHDLGLVHLGRAPATPATLRIDTRTPWVGQPLTLIGYGETARDKGDDGIKRMTRNTVAKVDPLKFHVRGRRNGCYGDSGGPLLADGPHGLRLIGVMSFITGPCGRSTLYASRLDGKLGAWIEAQLADAPLPPTDPPATPETTDDRSAPEPLTPAAGGSCSVDSGRGSAPARRRTNSALPLLALTLLALTLLAFIRRSKR